jgi:glycosyltransferase involved in cell wall biosynthesis
MKIVHVIPGLTRQRGGPTAVVEALVRHQVVEHSVTVLTTDQGARNGEQSISLAEGVRRVTCAVHGPDRLAYAPRFAEACAAELADCDLLHVHSIFTYPVHVALRTAFELHRPVVLRPCGLLHRFSLQQSRWIKAAYLARWGAFVQRAVTAWHYTSLAESAESWPSITTSAVRSPVDRLHQFVVPNGIEPDDFDIDRAQAARTVATLWPQLDGPYALFLGRLHHKKNVAFLVQQFLAAAPAYCKLVVAGPDESQLWSAIVARLKPAELARLVRIEIVAGEQKAALLAAATLFALPSQHENFGIAALEALAAGTPILLSPHVDLAASASAAGCGETVPLLASEWRSALARMLTAPALTDDDVSRRRRWVAENYAWSAVHAALMDRYRWTLAGCPQEASGVAANSN